MSDTDTEVLRANYTSLELHDLHEVLGFVGPEGSERSERVPIAEPKTNGDQWLNGDPAQIAVLAQIAAAVKERDEAMAAYKKQKPIAAAASSKAMSEWHKVREANNRALKLREALDLLKKAQR